MRKLIVTEFLTLDGVYEDSTTWQAGYAPDDGPFKRSELFESGALLLGRVTYEEFARYWPAAAGTGTFGERMNSLPKFVATARPGPLAWNATALNGNVVTAVQDLKRQGGSPLLTYGSGTLVQTLLRHGVVDELRLMVYPLILGKGRRLFPDGVRVPFRLVTSRDMGAGVLLLTYAPAVAHEAPGP